MREISRIILLFSTVLAIEFHAHSLKHVQKRHDIPLEFIMNSHEHSDIRRSAHLEKAGNFEKFTSDKLVVRRDESPPRSADSSTEVVGDETSVPDKFDQQSYGFMLPEGRAQKSTVLAVVDFITRKHNVKPTFVVNFDENQWFDVGEIQKTNADNADVYKVTIILKEGVNIDIAKTDDGGLYKFVVEAQHADIVLATTNISVDVISLAPTTKRPRVTVPDEPKMLGTRKKEEEPTTSSAASPFTESESLETSDPSESTNSTSSGAVITPNTTSESTPETADSEEIEVADSEESSADGSAAHPPDDDVVESSGDLDPLLTTSSNSEDPISGPIDILPLRTSSDGLLEAIDARLVIQGLPENGVINIPRGARRGDVIRGIHVEFKRGETEKSLKNIELDIQPHGYVEMRPRILHNDEKSMMFIEKLSDERAPLLTLEIVAKIGENSTIRTPLKLNLSETTKHSEGADTLKLRHIEFGVLESAESGRTIGHVDGDLKIIGGSGNQRFSLVGNDLILSCGQFDTEKCLQNDAQKTFSLILMPKNGSLEPVQVTIQVQQRANLRTSDKVLRISDNRIISPFAVITERTKKPIKLAGDAANFLGFVKSQENLYQLVVVNSAASGRYTLKVSLDDNATATATVASESRVVDVFVENSQSHAHFRKPKYSIEIDAKAVEKDGKLTQVELEGVPIDEAKIMILDGNPGWITVEEYGGRVNVGRYDGPIYNGKFALRIGAVDKKTWAILTETILEVDVRNGAEPERTSEITERTGKSRVVEATFDREKTEVFEIQLDAKNVKLDPKSVYGIDENGRKVSPNPTTITVAAGHLRLSPEPLKTLRLIGMTLKDGESSERLNILVRLISSPEYLETQKKISEKPAYPSPWSPESPVIRVALEEELAPGRVVGVFPAVSVIAHNYLSRKIDISGAMTEAFDFDASLGELKIKRRIDFESLDDAQKTFNLTLSSGEDGFRSVAILTIDVLDVDDNSPVIDVENVSQISLMEMSPNGTRIAQFNVTDPDGSASYTVEMTGKGSENFRADINPNGTFSLFIADNATLDRESQESVALHLKIADVSGNAENTIVPIRIIDENDNAPEFERKTYDIEVVENWPRGMVVGRLHATDSDERGPNSRVFYSLRPLTADIGDVVRVNESSGVVEVSDELWGLHREQPFKFHVTASDDGAVRRNSTAILILRIRGKQDIVTEESVQFEKTPTEVRIKENLAPATKIYQAKAVLLGVPSVRRGKLQYSLKDLINSEEEPAFEIDEDTGDVFVAKPIDFEKLDEYTLLITAFNSENEEVTSSKILKIRVENLDDNEPHFLESSLPVFRVLRNTSKPTAIGRLAAFDADASPIFYYLVPNCGNSEFSKSMTIDSEFGEIIYSPTASTVDRNVSNIELCFIATSQKSLDTSEVFFDGNSKHFQKILVEFVDSDETSASVAEKSIKQMSGNGSISAVGDVLDRVGIPLVLNSQTGDFELRSLQFVPANYELGRDVASPEGAVELNKKTGELVVSGRIVDTPQGVYTAEIVGKTGDVAVKQLHHIRNERKLRYIFSMSKNEYGANHDKFRRQILEAIGKDDRKGGKHLDIHFDEPTSDLGNSTWTSVCFYVTRENAILDEREAASRISPSNGHISKIHHIFRVQNVDSCSPKNSRSPESTASSGANAERIPLNTLILIGVVGLLIISLIGLLVFVCCVSRYQRYLNQKTERMRCNNSSAGSYYKSPNLLPPPPPGYVHTPPLPPPPRPAIGYY